MSFQAPPPTSILAAPSINDDVTKGIYVGMTAVDTTATPPVVYVCTSNNIGAAKWAPVGTLIRVGGVPVGTASALNFERVTASVNNGVANITPFGGWQNYAAFSAISGQTFFPLVGVSVAPQSHQVFANGMLLRLGSQYDYFIDATGITLVPGFVMNAGDPLIVYY